MVPLSPTFVAHGVRSRDDLPVDLPVLTWLLGLALALAFIGLVTFWNQPKLGPWAKGRLLGAPPEGARWVLKLIGLGLYLLVMTAGWIGANVAAENALPVSLYVTAWLGGQLVAALVGDLWSAVNPISTIVGWLDPRPERSLRPPPSNGDVRPDWGHWPAVLGLVIFLFHLQSHPTGNEPRTLAVLLTLHLFLALVATGRWGVGWVERNEPFTSLFAALATMAPIHHDGQRLRVRRPLAGLSSINVRSGTAAMLLVVIGGTTFDGFTDRDGDFGRGLFAELAGWTLALAELVGLMVVIAALAAVYGYGRWGAARATGLPASETSPITVAALVPITVGYTITHYFQLFIDNIQAFVFRLADPFGWGWNLFGLADNFLWQMDPGVTLWIQLGALLVAHLAALIVIHDLAIDRFPAPVATRGQLPMTLMVVAFNSLGLWLLIAA